MDNAALISWIKQSLKSETFEDTKVDLTGNSGKADGYLGEIVYIKVTGRDKSSGEDRTLNLVVKNGYCEDKAAMQYMSMVFRQEIEIYTNIFPSMLRFQLDKNVNSPFVNYPKCYSNSVGNSFEAIIFENLNSLGYKVHDRNVPLNIDHVKILLKAYAKCHATSLAFNVQRKEEFTNICSGLADFSKDRFGPETSDDFPKVVSKFFDSLLTLLKDRRKYDLHGKLQSLLKTDWNNAVTTMLEENTGFNIISHYDAWNNNYLFKYDAHDKTTPTDVKIIDWQMADSLNSPVYDLSHFLYNCASVQDLNDLEQLLRHYHDHLSEQLSQLGNDPEELFPFSLLKEHWKKFSLFGFIHVPYVIKQCHWDEEDIPSDLFGEDWSEWSDRMVVRDENYYQRLFGVVEHFLDYEL